MIKFYKEDFKYISRAKYKDFVYRFFVRGESFNYLLNKYNLKFYPNMEVDIYNKYQALVRTYTDYGIGYITGEKYFYYDNVELNNEDAALLFSLLEETMKQDL